MNLSIGTASVFTAGNPACNAVNPNTAVLFAQLQAAGVAVVVAAGNESSTSAMSFPGCATNAFAIGATNDADVPAGFTNSSADLRWWAPGVSHRRPGADRRQPRPQGRYVDGGTARRRVLRPAA